MCFFNYVLAKAHRIHDLFQYSLENAYRVVLSLLFDSLLKWYNGIVTL